MSKVHRISPKDYRRVMLNGVAIPLVAGLMFARESHATAPLLAVVVAIAAVSTSVWLAHWAGWISAPHVVFEARTRVRPTSTGSHPRLAIVSVVALLLLTGCPPLGGSKPPDEGTPADAPDADEDEPAAEE